MTEFASHRNEPDPAAELLQKYKDSLLTFEQLQNVPEPTWLIQDYLMAESVAVLWGDPGCGKSFVALDWAMSVATGTNWFGQKTRPGNVLYVLGEGMSGMRPRANAWVEAHNATPVGDQLLFLRRPIQIIEELSVDLVGQLVAEQGGVELIVIDTLARAIVGHSENDSVDMGKLVDRTERIKELTKATVVYVHHSNKSTVKTMRGSSALKGGIDTEIEMTNDEEQGRALHCRKQKDAAPFKERPVALMQVGHSLVPAKSDLTVF